MASWRGGTIQILRRPSREADMMFYYPQWNISHVSSYCGRSKYTPSGDARGAQLMRMQPIRVPTLQVRDGERPAEQEALNLIRAAGFEVLPLRFGFDTFRHRRQPQAFRHGNDGVDQRRVAPGLRSDVAHE